MPPLRQHPQSTARALHSYDPKFNPARHCRRWVAGRRGKRQTTSACSVLFAGKPLQKSDPAWPRPLAAVRGWRSSASGRQNVQHAPQPHQHGAKPEATGAGRVHARLMVEPPVGCDRQERRGAGALQRRQVQTTKDGCQPASQLVGGGPCGGVWACPHISLAERWHLDDSNG
jgi:hypothetical protein